MEPKKAKSAIIITIIIAAIIIIGCLGAILIINDVISVGSTEPEEAEIEEAVEVNENEAIAAVPSEADLKGASDRLQHPKFSNYLPEYENMAVVVERSKTTNMLYIQEPPENTWDIIAELPNNTAVKAIARENGYTLVEYKDGVIGWVLTLDLEAR